METWLWTTYLNRPRESSLERQLSSLRGKMSMKGAQKAMHYGKCCPKPQPIGLPSFLIHCCHVAQIASIPLPKLAKTQELFLSERRTGLLLLSEAETGVPWEPLRSLTQPLCDLPTLVIHVVSRVLIRFSVGCYYNEIPKAGLLYQEEASI